MSSQVTLPNASRLISRIRSKKNVIPSCNIMKMRWKASSDELSKAAFSNTATRLASCWLKPEKISSDFVAKSKSVLFRRVSGTQSACDKISKALTHQWFQIPFILFSPPLHPIPASLSKSFLSQLQYENGK